MREYLLIRSKRKTVALAIKEDGALEVRAPCGFLKNGLTALWNKRRAGSSKKQLRQPSAQPARRQLTPQEEENLRLRAQEYLPQRTWELAEQTGLNARRS